jgi:hypothetical protein
MADGTASLAHPRQNVLAFYGIGGIRKTETTQMERRKTRPWERSSSVWPGSRPGPLAWMASNAALEGRRASLRKALLFT